MNLILKELLNTLDAVYAQYEELTDTDVREEMYGAVYHGFMVQTPGYVLPEKFHMFDPAGDAAIRKALADFIPAACALGLPTPQQRFEAFQDESVISDADHPSYWYFGYADDLAQASAGYDDISNA